MAASTYCGCRKWAVLQLQLMMVLLLATESGTDHSGSLETRRIAETFKAQSNLGTMDGF